MARARADRGASAVTPPGAARPSFIRSGRLAGKSMAAAIWILAAPVLVQQTLHAFVGLTDKIIAGSLPPDVVVSALDGLGIGSYVGWFVGVALTGLGIGGQALIARAMGAGAVAEAERALGQSLLLALALGVVVGAALFALARPLALLCGLDPRGAAACVQYVRGIAYGVPANALLMVGTMCLHGAGETVRPSLVSALVGILNVPFSWLLSGADISLGGGVLANPLSLDLGVTGIALGTSLAWTVGALLTMGVLLGGVKDLRLRRGEVRPDRTMMRRVTRVGLPSFFEGLSMWAVNLLVLIIIGWVAARSGEGRGLQGAHIIAVQWEAFSFLPGFAMGTAAAALAGQYLGAGSPAQARRAVIACTVVAAAIMGGMGIVFMTCGTALTRVISGDPVHLNHVPALLFIGGLTQTFFAVAMVCRQALRGVGDTGWMFAITTFSSYAVRLPLAWLFALPLGLGLEGVWIGLCGELVVRSVLFAARFAHGGWARIEV
jgi:putative MATE family efflux protein